MHTQEDTYLSVARAAQILGLKQKTLANMRHDGRGPRFRKIGKRVTYSAAVLKSWLAERSDFGNAAETVVRRDPQRAARRRRARRAATTQRQRRAA